MAFFNAGDRAASSKFNGSGAGFGECCKAPFNFNFSFKTL